jgi:hypothetical protein
MNLGQPLEEGNEICEFEILAKHLIQPGVIVADSLS